MTAFEHRAAPTFESVEFRADGKGGDIFTGYAAVFESPSKEIFDPRESRTAFVETIAPGAFARSLGMGGRHDFVVDHNDRLHLSSTAGKLGLGEDKRGLSVESPWPRTDYADNVRALHEQGEPLGMSFTFLPFKNKGAQEWAANGRSRRLNEVKLGHVSVLASMVPAYNETSAGFRAIAYRTEIDMEELDNLLAAIKEGRDLTDDEKVVLRKLSVDLDPQPESDTPDEEGDEAPRADAPIRDQWKARLEEIAAA